MADGAVVVAQLVERSILSTEDHGSNPVIDKLLYRTFVHKTKIKVDIRSTEWRVDRKKNDD